MVLTDSDETNHPLLHVHVCVHCNKAIRREELEGRGHTTGIFSCPKCGIEGALNLEIRDVDDSVPALPTDE